MNLVIIKLTDMLFDINKMIKILIIFKIIIIYHLFFLKKIRYISNDFMYTDDFYSLK